MTDKNPGLVFKQIYLTDKLGEVVWSKIRITEGDEVYISADYVQNILNDVISENFCSGLFDME